LVDLSLSEGQLKGICRTKVGGRTVGDVRQALRQALNISPQAVAVVDGREAEEGYILLAGQQLEFVRLAGEKRQSSCPLLSLPPSPLSPQWGKTSKRHPLPYLPVAARLVCRCTCPWMLYFGKMCNVSAWDINPSKLEAFCLQRTFSLLTSP